MKRRKFSRKYIVGRIKSWDSIIKSAPDKKTKKLCMRFRNSWKRELRKLENQND